MLLRLAIVQHEPDRRQRERFESLPNLEVITAWAVAELRAYGWL
jgi:hypothetical protein